MLSSGDVIKFKNGLWIVMRVTSGSAYVIPLTGKPKPITTRKGVTKMVTGYPAETHISADSMVEKLDPESAYVRQVRRKMMGEPTATAEAPAKASKPRKTQVYVRTEKDAKEMKGQGAVILAALSELGQATVADLVAKTKGQFPTKQSEERVVGFYLSKFKREGLAKVTEVEAPATTEEPAAEIEA